MTKKPVLLSIFSFLLIGLIFGFSLVFAFSNNIETKLIFKESDSVYLDSLKLNRVKLLFESSDDLTEYRLESTCNTYLNKVVNRNNYYLFELKYFNNDCSDSNVFLVNNLGEKIVSLKLNIFSERTILEKLLDYDRDTLLNLQFKLNKKIKQYSGYIEYDKEIESNYYEFLKKNRLLNEYIFNNNVVLNIISKRSEKYLVPVIGKSLPTLYSKIPNSGRGYRNSYTDGIHHGWDIDADFGEQVVASDDGIIIRVVSEFNFSDLAKINKSKNLTKNDKVKNLDILRGKQVWLKTMKGDVIFYSHFNDILENIKEGYVVRKGEPIGTIGISGIPDKSYNDYHMHFPIHKNPYENKVKKYTFMDYMNWDWYFKGKSVNYILENQYNIFES